MTIRTALLVTLGLFAVNCSSAPHRQRGQKEPQPDLASADGAGDPLDAVDLASKTVPADGGSKGDLTAQSDGGGEVTPADPSDGDQVPLATCVDFCQNFLSACSIPNATTPCIQLCKSGVKWDQIFCLMSASCGELEALLAGGSVCSLSL